MSSTRLPSGTSDPISFICTCPASTSGGGLVLLFYRYYKASPPLLLTYTDESNSPSSLASFHTYLTQKHHLGGKVRIAAEGFNITVGGTKSAIEAYIQDCLPHWSFSGLDLSSEIKQKEFFKPTEGGCICVFGGALASVKVCEEATPMGLTGYLPERWDEIETLTPEAFHEKCLSEEVVLMDVRNHYESRIGFFVDPKTGEPAVRPEIRRFSQWPLYVRRVLRESDESGGWSGKQIMTYCTGGIRCEKGARFLQENVQSKVSTLQGGIAAYLAWMDDEVAAGRKKPSDSLFKGKNYVFDARGSTSMAEASGLEPVSKCHVCGNPEDRLAKCRSAGCHLILVICQTCETGDPRCCWSCFDMDVLARQKEKSVNSPRLMCECEKQREAQLWGNMEHSRPLKVQGWRKAKRKGMAVDNSINIHVKVFE